MRIALFLAVVLGAGCTTFSVTQIDESPNERTITTEIKGTAWFSAATTLTKLKAVTTDRQQLFGADTYNSQGATNFVEALNALARIAEAARPTP